ncbi:DUF637 domain-containing protein, partial [Cupriavidus sp. DL-D2]|uniref:DUF637 domain-containing protein n=1 Tax=Cupriavidus sp. DL-D2 TaxID=3144974 RepID=UPI0032143751
GFGIIGQIVAMAAAVAISIVTAGAGAAIVGAAYTAAMGATVAAGATFAAAGIGAAMSAAVSGLIAGTLSAMVSQVITTGSLNLGSALKTGLISGVTAGLTQGALGAMKLDNVGISSIGDNLAKGDWTLAAGQLGNYAQASVVRSAISAGISTAVYGGSFGQAFAGGLVRDAAALAANAVGANVPGLGDDRATTNSIIANAAAHALIGCAAQGLTGGDCAGGAIGGAASALAAPLIRDQLYADSAVVNYSDDKILQALTVGLSTMVGGLAGAALGVDVTSAGLAAQNEAINNATSTGPARGIAARENARLTKLCEPNCTEQNFRDIDTQVRKVEAAATLARLNNLTPEQALKLADTLSNLLPYYGSAAMLYQAVTGQTLSGQELGTAERWLSGVLGAIPVGAAAYGKISDFVKTWSLIDGAGGTINVPKSIPYQPPGSYISQGNAPVCGPACAAMVIRDNTGVSITLEEAIGKFTNGIRTTGVDANELSAVISKGGVRNSVETVFLPGQLNQSLSQGKEVIVNVGGHFIIVDSKVTVDGVNYYMTRDPFTGPRGVLASALDSAMARGVNAIVLGK